MYRDAINDLFNQWKLAQGLKSDRALARWLTTVTDLPVDHMNIYHWRRGEFGKFGQVVVLALAVQADPTAEPVADEAAV